MNKLDNKGYLTTKEYKWNLCNAILNMVRQAKGQPLRSPDENPYTYNHYASVRRKCRTTQREALNAAIHDAKGK